MACESILKYSITPKEVAEKKAKERKLNLLLLIQHFLKSEGYIESYNQLVNESRIPKEYDICDNIDIYNILQDYETYYFIRFQKYPKISKKVTVEVNEKKPTPKPKKPILKECKKEQSKEPSDSSIYPIVTPVRALSNASNVEDVFEENLPKPLGSFEGYSDEWKSMAEIISRDIVEKNLNVKWSGIAGLERAKILLKESIVYPMKYPELYGSAVTPWKGLLLYGPSGTGKTLLARAVASECKNTFFNISASSIVSKWRGDSEKLVRVMFDLARHEAPSIIFMDELDAIASQRGSSCEHEASRRLKSELLVQLDGLQDSNSDVLFLTTSNLPWDLDSAILRRLEKRIYVGLPGPEAREELIKMYLPKNIMDTPCKLQSSLNYQFLSLKCEGYSGADIKLLCKEVKMNAIRPVFKQLEDSKQKATVYRILNTSPLEPITDQHVINAMMTVKHSVSTLVEKYVNWNEEFGT